MRLSDVFRTILKVINFRKILVEKPARFWNRLIAVMLSDRREDEILVQWCRRQKFRVASPPKIRCYRNC